MPDDATPTMRAIADHMALYMDLRRARDEDRPLPYALSEAVGSGRAASPGQASRAIARLVKAGVICDVSSLPPLPGRRYGTRLYEAPPRGGLDEGREVGVEMPEIKSVQPAVEVEEDARVDRAHVLLGREFGMVATGDGAAVGHDHDVRSRDGRLAVDVYGSEDALVEAFIAEFDAVKLLA